jgi:hypothetical protein
MRQYVHCTSGEKGQKQFIYHLFSLITGIKDQQDAAYIFVNNRHAEFGFLATATMERLKVEQFLVVQNSSRIIAILFP